MLETIPCKLIYDNINLNRFEQFVTPAFRGKVFETSFPYSNGFTLSMIFAAQKPSSFQSAGFGIDQNRVLPEHERFYPPGGLHRSDGRTFVQGHPQ